MKGDRCAHVLSHFEQGVVGGGILVAHEVVDVLVDDGLQITAVAVLQHDLPIGEFGALAVEERHDFRPVEE